MKIVPGSPLITVRGLTIAYGDFAVQRNLTFTINRGDVYIIMGPSGCGKSSLLRVLTGLQAPAAGQVLYGDRDFWAETEQGRLDILSRTGVLFQSGALWSSMTLAENVALPLERRTDLSPAAVREQASLKLALVGLAGFEDFYPSEISGGMRKRAGLARALALDPEIVFFDEPSAGLDPLSAALLVLSILAGLALADRGGKKGFAAKQLAYCAMAVALAYVTSFIKVFKLPYGGSVTLLSMLFIVLVANWYGVKTGMLVGFAYGILQFLQEPYFLTLFQVCCDYVLAFAALGLAGTYELADLKKPFIVARIVPNLDAPEIKEAVASSYLQSIGLLFETPAQTQTAGLPAPTAGAQVEVIPEYPDETPEQTPKMPEQTPETPEQMPWGDPPEPDWEPELEGFFCADCGQELVETRARNGNLWKPEDIAGFSERRYGRRLCPSCQERARGGQKR